MSVLSSIHKGKRVKPRRTLLYGPHGCGKTTWASNWPSPIILDLEGGCNDLDVHSVRIKNAIDLYGAVIELGVGSEDYKTCVIDSCDWLEKMVWEELCKKHNKDSIADLAFGKGFKDSAAYFGKLLNAFDQVIDAGLHVVLLAHCKQEKVEPPDNESFHRYAPKTHEAVSGLLQEWCDEVLFCKDKTFTTKTDEGFNRKRAIVSNNSERVIYTRERPAWLAKNRLGLPEEMTMNFSEYEPFLNRKA
jgi:hypothetical protein